MHFNILMDHNYIDEFDIVERYLARRLAEGETAEFEEHFVDCLECVGRLETTKAFVDGLRRVASDRAAAAPDPSHEILVTERSTVSRKAFAATAGVLSVIIIAAAVLTVTQERRYRSEVNQARNASTESRYEEERQLSAANSKDHQESERELAKQVAQLKLDLENERKTGLHNEVQVNLPIFTLSSTRGGDTPPGSANDLTIPRSASTFVITLSLEEERRYRDYIMTIVDSQKEVIRKVRGIKANRDHAISVGFNSTRFHNGDYSLTLDGVARDGSISVVGKYSFRIRKTP
jgi:hypothetical protein